jgi:hypothetical protein
MTYTGVYDDDADDSREPLDEMLDSYRNYDYAFLSSGTVTAILK